MNKWKRKKKNISFYEKLGVKTLINASETYTNLGGSLMDPRTLKAMEEAGSGFVDISSLLDEYAPGQQNLRAMKQLS